MRRVAVIIGSEPGTGGAALPALPRSDRAAVGLALSRFGGRVQAYCLRRDEAALRYALAAGAASASYLADIATLDFDVVLVGGGGAEPWGDLLLARLAEQKQGAMVVDVLDLDPGRDEITVRRDLGRGSRETLALKGPAVLGIADDATQPLYVSHYRRQRVRAVLSAATADPGREAVAAVSGPWEAVRPRVKTGNLAARTAGSASQRMQTLWGIEAADRQRATVIVADAATCAQHLVRFLRHHGFIAGSASAPAVSPTSEPGTRSRQRESVTPIRRGPRTLGSRGRGMERGPRPVE